MSETNHQNFQTREDGPLPEEVRMKLCSPRDAGNNTLPVLLVAFSLVCTVLMDCLLGSVHYGIKHQE